MTYTGSAIKPKVTVYNKNGKKVNPKSYFVSYSNNKKYGYGLVKVKMNGKEETVVFQICSKTPVWSSVKYKSVSVK